MPAPSWPRIAGNRPSGSAPDSVNSSVWQTPVALISTRTSPAFGPSSLTVAISSGLPAATATAARTFISSSVRCQVLSALVVHGTVADGNRDRADSPRCRGRRRRHLAHHGAHHPGGRYLRAAG